MLLQICDDVFHFLESLISMNQLTILKTCRWAYLYKLKLNHKSNTRVLVLLINLFIRPTCKFDYLTQKIPANFETFLPCMVITVNSLIKSSVSEFTNICPHRHHFWQTLNFTKLSFAVHFNSKVLITGSSEYNKNLISVWLVN